MSHDRKSVDALLATAVSHLLGAGHILNRMRELHRQENEAQYWRVAAELSDCLEVGRHALDEAHRLMLAPLPFFVPEKGGLPN